MLNLGGILMKGAALVSKIYQVVEKQYNMVRDKLNLPREEWTGIVRVYMGLESEGAGARSSGRKQS